MHHIIEATAEFYYEIERNPEPEEIGKIMIHTNFIRPANMEPIQNRSRFSCSQPAREFIDDHKEELDIFLRISGVSPNDAVKVIQELIHHAITITSSVEYLPHYALTVWLTFDLAFSIHVRNLDDLQLQEAVQASLDEYEKKSKFPASKFVVESLELSSRRYKREENTRSSVDQCTICLEEFETDQIVVKLHCGHKFDKNCILKWLEYNHVCPLCRYDFPRESDEISNELSYTN